MGKGLFSLLSGGLLGRNKAALLFLYCWKKKIHKVLLFFSIPDSTLMLQWLDTQGWGRGMGNACYLNREPVAKLNINTDPPSEMWKPLLIALWAKIQWVVQSCDSSEAAQPCMWATECPAVKVEHCPWDAESVREGRVRGGQPVWPVSPKVFKGG